MVLWANVNSLGIHMAFISIFCWVFWFYIVNALPSEGWIEIELRHTNITHLPIQSHFDLFFYCRCFLDKHWREHLMSIGSRSAPGHKDELEADPVLKRSIRMGGWVHGQTTVVFWSVRGCRGDSREGWVMENVTLGWFEENVRKQRRYQARESKAFQHLKASSFLSTYKKISLI